MSLNNISLPAPLLADLYRHALIQSTARPVPEAAPVAYLGSNKKNVLILVKKDDAAYLPDGELLFLTTVLSACGLDLSHVAIVNCYNNKASATDLFRQFEPRQLLLFDVSPQALSLSSAPAYKVTSTGSLQFVAAPSLAEIEPAKEAKKALWLSLKQLFSL